MSAGGWRVGDAPSHTPRRDGHFVRWRVAGVRLIDRLLRLHLGVFEFTTHPDCILRLSRGRSPRTIVLSDGVRIEKHAPLLELHFWNERFLEMPLAGAELEWGLELIRAARLSLRELVRFLRAHPEYDDIVALHGEFGLIVSEQSEQMRRLLTRFGFDYIAGQVPGYRFWRYAFWQNLYSWWLMWTFDPASLHGKQFARLCRGELWMSRTRLLEKYG